MTKSDGAGVLFWCGTWMLLVFAISIVQFHALSVNGDHGFTDFVQLFLTGTRIVLTAGVLGAGFCAVIWGRH